MKVFCWASGQISFGRTTPEGALEIASAPYCALRKVVESVARLAYDNVTLLVPGVPEAPNSLVAVDAVIRFQGQVHHRLKVLEANSTGYRMLRQYEEPTAEKGDETCIFDGVWRPLKTGVKFLPVKPHNVGYFRRPVSTAQKGEA